MLEIAGDELRTESLSYHGLVAAVCKELRIAERVDEKFPKEAKERTVSPGKAVESMIINGLGFVNRRLYLTHQFFEDKPIERLLGVELSASDITAYTLSNTLDNIFDYGSSKFFGEIAFPIAFEKELLRDQNHLDTTSLTVQGNYDIKEDKETIDVTYGHSKDHRPDLKQVVLSMVTNGPSNVPIWVEPLNGNNSDQTSFHETIARMETFKKEIKIDNDAKWVADSALYTKEKLLNPDNKFLWLTRVPEKSKAAKKFVEMPESEITWEEQGNGYKIYAKNSTYGGIKQRWLLVYSEQAFKRESQTFEKKLAKQSEELKKSLWHLSNEIFESETEAMRAANKLGKKFRLFMVEPTLIEHKLDFL